MLHGSASSPGCVELQASSLNTHEHRPRHAPRAGVQTSSIDSRLVRIPSAGDGCAPRRASLVAAHEDAEACVCDLTEPVNLSQPTVSHHLKVLVDAGLLTRSKRGTWSFYALVPGALDQLAGILRTP